MKNHNHANKKNMWTGSRYLHIHPSSLQVALQLGSRTPAVTLSSQLPSPAELILLPTHLVIPVPESQQAFLGNPTLMTTRDANR